MQFVARLHTPRKDVINLQNNVYAANPALFEAWAKGALAQEPVGAWVEILERVEVLRKKYVKVEGPDNAIHIETFIIPAGIDSTPSQERSNAAQEPGSGVDASGK